MRKTCITILLVSVCCLLPMCSRKPDAVTSSPAEVRTPAQLNQTEKNMVESVNRFSFKLFQAVNNEADPSKNVFVSPLSVSYALGMLRNGAEGATRVGIDSALELVGFTIDDANQAYKSLTTILTQADSAVVFKIANSLWSREGSNIRPGFVDVGRQYFDARVEEVNFQNPQTVSDINNWVKDNTGGLIDKIVDPPISDNVIAMLLNALYFKGNWTYPFDTAQTNAGVFHAPGGVDVSCDFMHKRMSDDSLANTELFLRSPATFYADTTLFCMTLPYGNHGFRMTILLPNRSIPVDQLLDGLTQESWNGWISSSRISKLWFRLPKFEFEFETKLNDILKGLGMTVAFDPDSADFRNMFDMSGVYISDVRHKAFVKVDEKGTAAAAVTSVTIGVTNSGPLVFNRPFLFVIHETESGAILFMGKVVNPTLKS